MYAISRLHLAHPTPFDKFLLNQGSTLHLHLVSAPHRTQQALKHCSRLPSLSTSRRPQRPDLANDHLGLVLATGDAGNKPCNRKRQPSPACSGPFGPEAGYASPYTRRCSNDDARSRSSSIRSAAAGRSRRSRDEHRADRLRFIHHWPKVRPLRHREGSCPQAWCRSSGGRW